MKRTWMMLVLAALLALPALAAGQQAQDRKLEPGAAVASPLNPAADIEFLEGGEAPAPTLADPIEPFNRGMFWVNDKLYFYLLKPTAQVYSALVIKPVRTGVNNAFHNVRSPLRFINCLFQGRFTRAGQELGSFLLNSTFGIGGLFRVSDGVEGLNPEDDEDLDQTLGTWGIGQGFYIVWPVLGPSSPRGSVGYAGDHFLDPLTWIIGGWGVGHPLVDFDKDKDWIVPLAVSVGERVNNVSLRIGDYEAFKRDAIDPYLAMRDAYVQNRAARVEK